MLCTVGEVARKFCRNTGKEVRTGDSLLGCSLLFVIKNHFYSVGKIFLELHSRNFWFLYFQIKFYELLLARLVSSELGCESPLSSLWQAGLVFNFLGWWGKESFYAVLAFPRVFSAEYQPWEMLHHKGFHGQKFENWGTHCLPVGKSQFIVFNRFYFYKSFRYIEKLRG